MKKIGLVDYFISEWHANNYPGWIRELCKKENLDYEIAYAYAELDLSPVTGESTDEWCKRMGVQKCLTIDELCEMSDFIIILAPSHPETHLHLAKEVLKHGKRTYIDKTFAPEYETAKEIFRLSDEGGAPIFSTSALRYAEELRGMDSVSNIITTGGGSNLAEYAIHQIEMAVMLLKCAPVSLKLEKQGMQSVIRVKFEEDKFATMVYSPALPFSICTSDGNTDEYKEITSDFFAGLMVDVINFFETGKVSFDKAETLNAIKIRGGIISAMKKEGEWLAL